MKYLKSYEQINEEMNWKKLAVGGALVGSLIGCTPGTPGTPGCDVKDKKEQTVSDSKINEILKKSIFDELTIKELNLLYEYDKNGFEYYQGFIEYEMKDIPVSIKAKYYGITINRFLKYIEYNNEIKKKKLKGDVSYDNLLKKFDSEIYNFYSEKIYPSEAEPMTDEITYSEEAEPMTDEITYEK